MKRLDELKGFQEWQASGPAGISYKYDKATPAGVLARLEAHKEELFECQRRHAAGIEFCQRAAGYGVEGLIFFDDDMDARSRRRLISNLKRNTEDLQTLFYRSWLGECGWKNYAQAELVIMRQAMRLIGGVRDKLDDLVQGEFEKYSEDDLQDARSPIGLSQRFWSDIVETLDCASEWLEIQVGDFVKYVPATWEQLQVDPKTIAALEGREPQDDEPVEVPDDGTLLSTKQAAEYLAVTENYLKQMRHYGTGPSYSKVKTDKGDFQEAVMYAPEDIREWLRAKPETLARCKGRNAPIIADLDTIEAI